MHDRVTENHTYYVKTKDRYRESRALSRQVNRDRIHQAIVAAKDRPCADCGIEYPYYVMDFDHRGDKSFTIGSHRHGSLERVLTEIAKCDIVCANCHMERTHGRVAAGSLR